MKHSRSAAMNMIILLTALAAILPSQEAAQAVRDANRLAEPQEKRFNDVQPPELVLDILGIRPGLIIGEVGAGHGRVTVHLAARVGDKGKVYANDIDPAAVDYLRARCRRQGLANVEPILSLPDDARFPQNSLDLALMTYVYHHVDEPVPLLKSLLPSLEPWGFVALAEPKPEHAEDHGKVLTQSSVGEEAGFLARLKDSIRPGGYVVFEHVVQHKENRFSPGVHALAPGALRELFKDFEILVYQEMDHAGDWGGPPTPHVRMLARRRG